MAFKGFVMCFVGIQTQTVQVLAEDLILPCNIAEVGRKQATSNNLQTSTYTMLSKHTCMYITHNFYTIMYVQLYMHTMYLFLLNSQ